MPQVGGGGATVAAAAVIDAIPLPQQLSGGTPGAGGLGAAAFCPRGSAAVRRVRRGYYSIGPSTKPRSVSEDADLNTRRDEVRCEAGHYCVSGIRHPCPAGRFGATTGLDNARCSGPCAPGYFCPIGSSSKNEQTSYADMQRKKQE